MAEKEDEHGAIIIELSKQKGKVKRKERKNL